MKSNLGHLLTAAGMPSLIKAILSMNQGVIPPTIGIQNPLSSANGVISADKIVTRLTPWQTGDGVKRAAVSSFGFGGTNSHLVLEHPSAPESAALSLPAPAPKLAIVGMDAAFGSCQGLEEFERCIYQGKQPVTELPKNRWQGIEGRSQVLRPFGFEQAPKGAYMQEFEMDYLQFRIPPDAADQPTPQQLLVLKVADKALKDAKLKRRDKCGGNCGDGDRIAFPQSAGAARFA
ncbi:MAG: hypothetical protein HC936_15910 [Leptolyngbyaceae cyanobacterium SU_3_3]|nr:hypothetical protein [Leptolyngbyaceae cyanobacterium SU_3_3]